MAKTINPVAVGSTVYLPSGSPKLTIISMDGTTQCCTVGWFVYETNTYMQQEFPMAVFGIASDEQETTQ